MIDLPRILLGTATENILFRNSITNSRSSFTSTERISCKLFHVIYKQFIICTISNRLIKEMKFHQSN